MLIETQIEISCPPAKVREVFMDFADIPSWTQGFIKSIAPKQPEKSSVEKGDSLNVQLEGMSFSPVVLENSERQFQWSGRIPYVLYGDHYFRYEPSKTTPGGTTFSQGEHFHGPLAFVLDVMPMGAFAKAKPGFEGFNQDLKRRCESGK